LWDDEYEDEKNEITVYRWKKDNMNEDQEYYKQEVKLPKGEQYYLVFCSKNRRGSDNSTGLDVLVMKPNFNNNTCKEIGWCSVTDDKNY
jgi:hypothetical protein